MPPSDDAGILLLAAALLIGTACVSAVLIRLLQPLLLRYALARPNARSSHREPTPQGGGMAVVAATVAAVVIALIWAPGLAEAPRTLAAMLATAVALAVLGAIDDIRPLAARPRLLLQLLAVAGVIAVLPEGLRALPALPLWLERVLLVVALLWFVNLTNFMDGIDWMTVAEIVPLTFALALFGLAGALPGEATLVAIALCGAMLGFAPFNRPVARLFLGDVGSLPIGVIAGWLLILLAGNGHLAAALLLPLYYGADATITLLRRAARGENVTQAHRSHFYQQALDHGMSAMHIVTRVAMLNVALAILAAATLLTPSHLLHAAALVIGAALTGQVLYRFASAKA